MNKRKAIWFIVILVFALLFGVGAYCFFVQNNEKTEKQTVKHDTAEKLYKEQDGETCTEVNIVSHNAKVSWRDMYRSKYCKS